MTTKYKSPFQAGITYDMTGKMEFMSGYSTSCKDNKRCEENAKIPGSVCEKCYAQRSLNSGVRKNLLEKLARNTEYITAGLVPEEDLPLINRLFFRYETHGDLANWYQVANYFRACEKNPLVSFTLWTKNPDIIQEAMDRGYKKPANLQIVQSSLFLNTPVKPFAKWIDKIFTVYTADYAIKHNVRINCGWKKCFTCRTCYTRNDVFYINEIEKSELKKYMAAAGISEDA